jgi:hypothetical protein
MPSDLTAIEELDQNILTLCTRINSATYELLVLIREFDERAGWLQWGLDNCAEWLAWRCDLSMTTAREKVRVAHALKQLPLISQAFSSGELSYAKVRAMTRVTNRDNEQQQLEFALRHTAVTVAERCRALRCGRETSIGTAERAWANRSLRIRRDVERNLMTITVDLPLDTGELLEKALDKARDDEALEIPDLVDTCWSVRQADAFVNILNGFLSGGIGSNNDNHLVTIHVDAAALAGSEGRAAVPIEAVKRHCCDGHGRRSYRSGQAPLLRRPRRGHHRDDRRRAARHRPKVAPGTEIGGTGGTCERQTLLRIPGLHQSPLPRLPPCRALGAWRRDQYRQPDALVHEAPHPGARGWLPDRQGFPG